MSDKKKTEKEQFNEGYIQELRDAGESVAARGKVTQKAVDKIMSSINNPGTKGEVHKGMLLVEVGNLERLTALCSSISTRLLSAAEKLANGTSEVKVMSDIVVYSRFVTDQLKREVEESQYILDTLQDNDQHN